MCSAALSLRHCRRPSAAQRIEESSSYIVLWMKAATGKKARHRALWHRGRALLLYTDGGEGGKGGQAQRTPYGGAACPAPPQLILKRAGRVLHGLHGQLATHPGLPSA